MCLLIALELGTLGLAALSRVVYPATAKRISQALVRPVYARCTRLDPTHRLQMGVGEVVKEPPFPLKVVASFCLVCTVLRERTCSTSLEGL